MMVYGKSSSTWWVISEHGEQIEKRMNLQQASRRCAALKARTGSIWWVIPAQK